MALKDITLGQYFPGHTVIHRLDPRTKLIFTVAYIVALFLARQVSPMPSCWCCWGCSLPCPRWASRASCGA